LSTAGSTHGTKSDSRMTRKTPTPSQVREARGLLNIGQDQLAEMARLSLRTIKRFELETAPVSESAVEAIQKALEAEGIEFLEDDGLKLRRRR
jgi:transcriptional regulator with XRE-family HTH domain